MNLLMRRLIPAAAAVMIAFSATIVTALAAPASADVTCPNVLTNTSFVTGSVAKFDDDNPVRVASTNADKNLEFRGFIVNPTATLALNNPPDSGTDTAPPPQLATIFNPTRAVVITAGYQVNGWTFRKHPSPDVGESTGPMTTPRVTLLGLQTTPGEQIRNPCSRRGAGSPWGAGGAVVLFANADSITLAYTDNDSAATGYVVHIVGVNVDPNLLDAYNAHDSGNRYNTKKTTQTMVGLKPGQVLGQSGGNEIKIGIRLDGSFKDPRSEPDWWQVTTWKKSPYTVPGPSLLAPAHNAVLSDASPDFSWTAMTGASTYKIDIDDNADFSSPVATPAASASLTYTASPDLAQGTYFWRVRAFNASSTQIGITGARTLKIDLRPPKVTTISPNGLTNVTTPDFSWNASDTPDTETYTLSLTGVDTRTPVSFVEGTDVTCTATCTVPWPASWAALVTNGAYNFTVKAVNSFGDHGASAPRTFTLDTKPLAVPVLTSPKNGTPNFSKTKALVRTKPVKTTTLYEFELRSKSSGLLNKANSNSIKSSTTYALGMNFGSYIWTARTVDAAGNRSAWSTPFTFTYTLLTSPKSGKVMKTGNVILRWKSVAGATSYQVAYSTDPAFDPNNNPPGPNDVFKPASKLRTFNTKTAPLANGTYYWTVRVNGGVWMPVWHFTVNAH